jgi:hypothetical protein
MGWYVTWAVAFAVSLLFSFTVKRGRAWLLAIGVAVAVIYWLILGSLYGFEGDVTAGGWFILVVGSLSAAWALGVFVGYAMRTSLRFGRRRANSPSQR